MPESWTSAQKLSTKLSTHGTTCWGRCGLLFPRNIPETFFIADSMHKGGRRGLFMSIVAVFVDAVLDHMLPHPFKAGSAKGFHIVGRVLGVCSDVNTSCAQLGSVCRQVKHYAEHCSKHIRCRRQPDFARLLHWEVSHQAQNMLKLRGRGPVNKKLTCTRSKHPPRHTVCSGPGTRFSFWDTAGSLSLPRLRKGRSNFSAPVKSCAEPSAPSHTVRPTSPVKYYQVAHPRQTPPDHPDPPSGTHRVDAEGGAAKDPKRHPHARDHLLPAETVVCQAFHGIHLLGVCARVCAVCKDGLAGRKKEQRKRRVYRVGGGRECSWVGGEQREQEEGMQCVFRAFFGVTFR